MATFIKAENYPKLIIGKIYLFTRDGGEFPEEKGKLLYAYSRKNFLYDKKGEITNNYVLVPHKCGYTPIENRYIYWENSDENLLVEAVHLCPGKFQITEVE